MTAAIQLLASTGGPALACVLLGVIQAGRDYLTTGKVVPSLVDGVIVGAEAGVSMLAANGVRANVQRAQAARARAIDGARAVGPHP